MTYPPRWCERFALLVRGIGMGHSFSCRAASRPCSSEAEWILDEARSSAGEAATAWIATAVM
jgi:hypothetical protein